MSVTVLYFASLRDAAGVASEVCRQPASLRALYEEAANETLSAHKVHLHLQGIFGT